MIHTRWVTFRKELDLGVAYDEEIAFGLDFSSMFAVDRVMLQEIHGVVESQERIVDSDHSG